MPSGRRRAPAPAPPVTVRHHRPDTPDPEALRRAREIWLRGLVQAFKRRPAGRDEPDPRQG